MDGREEGWCHTTSLAVKEGIAGECVTWHATNYRQPTTKALWSSYSACRKYSIMISLLFIKIFDHAAGGKRYPRESNNSSRFFMLERDYFARTWNVSLTTRSWNMRPDPAVSTIHWVSAEQGSRDLVTEMGNINCLAKCYYFSYQKSNHTSRLEHILVL